MLHRYDYDLLNFYFLISIIRNRYITICHPLKIKWHFSKRSTMYCILGIWVFGSIPSYLWVEFTQVSTNKFKKSLSNIPSYYIKTDPTIIFHVLLKAVYIYYSPWEKYVRNFEDDESELIRRNFTRIEKSSMCLVS